jgi:hypothetical protein
MILGAGAIMPILAIFFLGDRRRLADMALATFATAKNLDRLQSLSRELNSVLRHYILGLIDNAHPATAKLFDDAVVRDGMADHAQHPMAEA